MRTMFKTSALRPITIILVALFVLTPFFAWPAGQDPGTGGTLRRDLAAILDEAPLRPAHVGIIVESLTTGNRLFEYNGEKRFVPASNMKLFTTAAALLALSPDFRYETRLFTDGMVHSGVLRGNLIIKGSGDPTISGYFNDNNPLYVFEQWASKLKEAGIKEVRGNIVIDNSLFSGRPYGAGWLVEDTTNCYSAPKDAFTFNNNCVQLDISPALKPGEYARIVMEPVTSYIRLINNVKTVNAPVDDMISFGYSTPRTLNASGTVAPGSEATTHYIAVAHPAYFGGFVFKETLASGGISMKGGIVCTRNCPTTVATPVEKKKDPWKTIAVYRSPKLSEIIKVVNKMSNNLYAELLLLTIGKAAGNVSGTQEATVAAISSLKSAGIDTEGLTMADGSGLSRYNLVTPRAVIQLLKVMANGPYAPQFMGSLPAMSTEGTLRNRLKGSQAVGRIRAKTGTMVHVRSLSGYITTKHDETLVFSILCNNFDVPVSTIDDVMNRIILRLLEYQGAGR